MHKLIRYLGVLGVAVLPLCSQAMPVEDFGEWIRTAQVSSDQMEQLSQLYKQYTMIQNQYKQLQQQYHSITGTYGWGNFNNSQSQLTQDHEWAPSDWKSALAGMSGGNPARYQQLLSQYKAAHPSLSESSFEKGSDVNLAAGYHNAVLTNQASSTQASYEMNDINAHMKALYQLGQQIENANKNNDLKSSMDLNSRIQLEIGYISVEELRMSALMNEQAASRSASQLTKAREAATFNQAGEQP